MSFQQWKCDTLLELWCTLWHCNCVFLHFKWPHGTRKQWTKQPTKDATIKNNNFCHASFLLDNVSMKSFPLSFVIWQVGMTGSQDITMLKSKATSCQENAYNWMDILVTLSVIVLCSTACEMTNIYQLYNYWTIRQLKVQCLQFPVNVCECNHNTSLVRGRATFI